MLDLEALLRVPCVEVEMGFDLSPDGGKAAFSWNPDGRWEIFEVSLNPGAQPRPVSSGPGGKFHPRYSPDGRRLAYVVDLDGSENYHICILDLASRHQVDMTPEAAGAIQAFFSWSPDGKNIAYISDRSGQFDTYLMRVGRVLKPSGKDLHVLDAGHPAWKVRWSPDGSWLAVTVEAGGIEYGTFIVPALGSGEVSRIADESGPIDAGQTRSS